MLLQQSAVTVLLQRYSKLTYPLANLHYQKKMFFFFRYMWQKTFGEIMSLYVTVEDMRREKNTGEEIKK